MSPGYTHASGSGLVFRGCHYTKGHSTQKREIRDARWQEQSSNQTELLLDSERLDYQKITILVVEEQLHGKMKVKSNILYGAFSS